MQIFDAWRQRHHADTTRKALGRATRRADRIPRAAGTACRCPGHPGCTWGFGSRSRFPEARRQAFESQEAKLKSAAGVCGAQASREDLGNLMRGIAERGFVTGPTWCSNGPEVRNPLSENRGTRFARPLLYLIPFAVRAPRPFNAVPTSTPWIHGFQSRRRLAPREVASSRYRLATQGPNAKDCGAGIRRQR